LYEAVTDLSNYLSSPLSISKFVQEGVLTPEEFIAAGDLLVLKCPSWSWLPAKSGNIQKGLPKDKNYLLTAGVPCSMRVNQYESTQAKSSQRTIESEDGDGGWIATNENEISVEEVPEIPTDEAEEDIPEINLSDLSVTEVEDKATLHDNIMKTRTYDVTICYDQYHQTPRVWLFGYDESRNPLKPEEVLQDISQDHVNKTVTIATHPHTGIPQAYIHPCKHAAVMKNLVQRMILSGKIPRVDQYLFLFLKLISTAIPTIEYDNTVEVELQ